MFALRFDEVVVFEFIEVVAHHAFRFRVFCTSVVLLVEFAGREFTVFAEDLVEDFLISGEFADVLLLEFGLRIRDGVLDVRVTDNADTVPMGLASSVAEDAECYSGVAPGDHGDAFEVAVVNGVGVETHADAVLEDGDEFVCGVGFEFDAGGGV